MANIRTDIDYTIVDGAEIIFKAPCDSCTVTGLKVYYPNSDGIIQNEVFVFKDAHGNKLTDLDTFKANAMVKVILNTTDHTAYIQNADTNAYLEGRFDAIIDGTTQVGNAKTLDGHGAEYFASAEDVKNGLLCYALTSGFDLNNAFGRYATSDGATTNTLLNKPSGVSGGEVYVEYLPTRGTIYGIQNLYHSKYDSSISAYRTTKYTRSFSSTWGPWEKDTKEADLANYFKNTGGDINGFTKITQQDVIPLSLINDTGDSAYVTYSSKDGVMGMLGFNGVNRPVFYKNDWTAQYVLLHTGNMASHVLPLDGGGKVTGSSSDTPIMINGTNTSTKSAYVQFMYASGNLGHLGFDMSGKPTVKNSSGTTNELLHTGNSAKVVINPTAPSDTSALWVY